MNAKEIIDNQINEGFVYKRGIDADYLKMHFPWQSGYSGEKDLEGEAQFIRRYYEYVKKEARSNPSLREHVELMGKVVSGMNDVGVRLKHAETALYRI